MSSQKTNHICKNINCKLGIHGSPKEYWACDDCNKLHSYREIACSPECYKEYITQVLTARNEIVVKEEIKEETVENAIIERAIIEEVVTTKSKLKGRAKISEEAEL